MSTDYSVECYIGDHLHYIPATIACPILYGVGIPLIAVGLLWQWRFSLHDHGARSLQFFCTEDRHERFYWEVVVLVRKVAVIAMSIFMFTGDEVTRYQSPVASWFFVACLLVHLIAEPFDQITEYGRVCSVLESSAICACICTLNAGIIFGTHADGEHGVFEGLVLLFTIVVNVVVGILFAYHIFKSGWTKSKERVCENFCVRAASERRIARRMNSIHDATDLVEEVRSWVHHDDEMPAYRVRELELQQRSKKRLHLIFG